MERNCCCCKHNCNYERKYYKFNKEYVRTFGKNDNIIYQSKQRTMDKYSGTLIELENYGWVNITWLIEVEQEEMILVPKKWFDEIIKNYKKQE